jgi:membrane dipeptidase
MSDAALDLHMDAIVVDGHADTIGRFLDDGEDLGSETGKGHLDLPRMFRGGLDAQFMSCWVEPKYVQRKEAAKRALRMIDAVKQWAAKYPDRLAIARSAAEVRRAVAQKKVCGILCIEGGHAIEDDLGLLRSFFELGVRYMTLTWNNSLGWAEAARDPGKVRGLSDFGRAVVREMNRLGMLVDLSHVSENTFWDAIAVADTPVIASHSCARALCDHVRNLRDEQLKALAKNGGVVGVNFYSGFLSQTFYDRKRKADADDDVERATAREKHRDDPAAMDRALKEISRRYDASEAAMARPPLDLLIDHIEHIAKVAGIDHVGLGSDFDGVTALPEGVNDCSELPNLTRRLLERGFSASDVRKVLGENFLRVMERSIDRVAPQGA